MGLDGVELIMEVEDQFEIQINDNAYSELRTVGDLHSQVVQQLELQQALLDANPGCVSVAPFVATRQAIMSLVPVTRSAVRPRSPLAAIIPHATRRDTWSNLQSLTSITLPSLILPPSLRVLVAAIAAIAIIAATIGAIVYMGPAGLILAVMASIILGYLMYAATRPLAVAFPPHCSTIGDVVRRAGPPHYPRKRITPMPVDSDAVWKKVVGIVASVLSVSETEIASDTRFIEDLNAG